MTPGLGPPATNSHWLPFIFLWHENQLTSSWNSWSLSCAIHHCERCQIKHNAVNDSKSLLNDFHTIWKSMEINCCLERRKKALRNVKKKWAARVWKKICSPMTYSGGQIIDNILTDLVEINSIKVSLFLQKHLWIGNEQLHNVCQVQNDSVYTSSREALQPKRTFSHELTLWMKYL